MLITSFVIPDSNQLEYMQMKLLVKLHFTDSDLNELAIKGILTKLDNIRVFHTIQQLITRILRTGIIICVPPI